MSTNPEYGAAASLAPSVLVFDVNETLSDMTPIGDRFADVGAPDHLATSWFAGLLRDGFALTVTGTRASFSELAAEGLRGCLHGLALDRDIEAAVSHIMDGFSSLSVHADVTDGIEELAGLGVRMVTLSNGSTEVAERLLQAAGLRDRFERLLSVEAPGVWKPGAAAYAHALEECRVKGAEAMLVAVHPWDVDGAAKAGLRTAWINRQEVPYPRYFSAPDVEATSLPHLAELLR